MTEKIIKRGLAILITLILVVAWIQPWKQDKRTLSKSGSMDVLIENGIVTLSDGAIIYNHDNMDGISRIELEALVRVSNDSIMVFIIDE